MNRPRIILILAIVLNLQIGRAQDPRAIINLNGTWEFDQTTRAFPPEKFTRKIPVPGLIHLAEPRIMGRLIRFTRASLLDVLGQDYVRTAYAKGLTARQVALRHALRNALIPIVTLLGLSIPQLLSSSIVVETVVAWPGMGRLVVESAFQRNYTVLMGEIVLVGVLVVIGNLLADVAYAVVDP
jgi:ABC-type antimicrobial peptide transport system permease subunit